MSELIDRQRVIKNLQIIEGVSKNHGSKFIWASVYKQLGEEPVVNEKDCMECMLSLPRRKWHYIDTGEVPEVRKRVLVQTDSGRYFVSYYASKCWWYEDNELGDISFFFDKDHIMRWKEIE